MVKNNIIKSAFFVIVLSLIVGFICFNNEVVYANTLTKRTIINDETITGNINIDDSFKNGLYVVDGCTLTLKDVAFTNSYNGNYNNLITVNSNAKLILDNVNFMNLKGDVLINNFGVVEANNCLFGAYFNTAIKINSLKENPCVLDGKIFLSKIEIENGYITIKENISITNKISVEILNEFIGKRIVTGINTIPAYYLDKFVYLGSFNSLGEPGYFDYVGDGYENIKESEKSKEFLKSGDIILTSNYCKYKDGNVVYFAGKYCTGNRYLLNNNQTIKIIGGSFSTKTFLDNTTCLYASNYIYNGDVSTDNININLNFLNKNNLILNKKSSVLRYTKSSFYIEIPEGYKYDVNNNYNNENIICDFYNSKFIKFIINDSLCVFNNTLKLDVLLKEKTLQTEVQLNMDKIEFEYNKTDIKNQLKPYYIFNDSRVDINNFDIKCNDTVVNQCINVSEYLLEVKDILPDDIILLNKTIKFKISPKLLRVICNDFEFEYDGKSHSISVDLNGIILGDEVLCNYENNARIKPGNQNVKLNINNPNYALDKNIITLIISKGIFDVNSLNFEQISTEYLGSSIYYNCTNYDNYKNIIKIIPSPLNNKFINVGKYDYVINFELIENEFYDRLSENKIIKKLIINPKDISVSLISKSYTFTGEDIILDYEFSGVLNNDNLNETYTKHKNEGLYDFDIKINNNNYNLINSSFKYEIKKLSVDLLLEKNSFIYSKNNLINDLKPYYILNNNKFYIDNYDVFFESNKITNITNVGKYILKISNTNIKNIILNKNSIEFEILPKLLKVVCDKSVFDYDSNPHSLNISLDGVIDGDVVECFTSNNSRINAGNQTVLLYIENENYYLDKQEINLIINKVCFDRNLLKFEQTDTIYNGNNISFLCKNSEDFKGLIVSVSNNIQKNAGNYKVKVVLKLLDDSNYNSVNENNFNIDFKIEKRNFKIELTKTNYEYSPNGINLEYKILNTINSDELGIKITTYKNVGQYPLLVSIKNDNYNINIDDVKYVIYPKSVDVSNIKLEESQSVYSGANCILNIAKYGTIEGLKSFELNYEKENIKNVGRYDIYADIEVEDNYKKPVWKSVYVIIPREITIIFSNYQNLIEDGNIKNIIVEFVNLVDDNFKDFEIEYSSIPKLKGLYTCTVSLKENSNYIIKNNNVLNFEIFSSITEIEENTFKIKVDTKFLLDENLKIETVDDTKIIETSLKALDINVKNLNVFKFTGDTDKDFDVCLDFSDYNISSLDNYGIYKFIDGKLTKINFSSNGSKLIFNGDDNGEFVIFEKQNSKNISNITIIMIVISSILVFAIIIGFIIYVFIRKNKLLNKDKNVVVKNKR